MGGNYHFVKIMASYDNVPGVDINQTNTNQDMHQTSTKHAPNMQSVVGSYFDAIHMYCKKPCKQPHL